MPGLAHYKGVVMNESSVNLVPIFLLVLIASQCNLCSDVDRIKWDVEDIKEKCVEVK